MLPTSLRGQFAGNVLLKLHTRIASRIEPTMHNTAHNTEVYTSEQDNYCLQFISRRTFSQRLESRIHT